MPAKKKTASKKRPASRSKPAKKATKRRTTRSAKPPMQEKIATEEEVTQEPVPDVEAPAEVDETQKGPLARLADGVTTPIARLADGVSNLFGRVTGKKTPDPNQTLELASADIEVLEGRATPPPIPKRKKE